MYLFHTRGIHPNLFFLIYSHSRVESFRLSDAFLSIFLEEEAKWHKYRGAVDTRALMEGERDFLTLER